MNAIRQALEKLVDAVDSAYDVEDLEVVKAAAYARAVLDLTPKETN